MYYFSSPPDGCYKYNKKMNIKSKLQVFLRTKRLFVFLIGCFTYRKRRLYLYNTVFIL